MKIYAANIPDFKTEFDEYIGKDVFVKCIMYEDPVYVRFLSKSYYAYADGRTIPIVKVSYFDAGYLSRYQQTTPKWPYLNDLGDTKNVALTKIRLDTPLTVIPIKDLYGELPVRRILPDFVGTDIWIHSYTSYENYIRVLAIDDGMVKFNWLDMTQLETIENGVQITPGEKDALDDVFSAVNYKFIDGIQIYEPLEMLTTDEITEMIENCQVVD